MKDATQGQSKRKTVSAALKERRRARPWHRLRLKRLSSAEKQRCKRKRSSDGVAKAEEAAGPPAKRRQFAAEDTEAWNAWGRQEAGREESGLALVGELAPDGLHWHYPLVDEHRRCYTGYLPTAVGKEEASRLFQAVKEGTNWLQPKGRWGPLPLRTAWMTKHPCTCKYRYGGAEVLPESYTPWMEDVMSVCMPLCGLTRREDWPNSCNLNMYVDGSHSVGWHADNESLFQGKFRDCRIISLSLGQTRKFELRCGRSFHSLHLSDGDLCTMEGLTQKYYTHRVPKEGNDCKKPRINLTWRWVVAHADSCTASQGASAGKVA